MEEKETKESKVKKWAKKYEADIAALIFMICLCLVIFLVSIFVIDSDQTSNSKKTSEERMVILQEMYYENSKDIIRKADLLANGCKDWQYMRDDHKDFDYWSIDAYLDRYDLRIFSDFSEEQYNIEVDAFVYVFKDDFVLTEDFNMLLKKREFVEKEMRKMEEKTYE